MILCFDGSLAMMNGHTLTAAVERLSVAPAPYAHGDHFVVCRRERSMRRRCWATFTSARSGPSWRTMCRYRQPRFPAPAWTSSSRNTRERTGCLVGPPLWVYYGMIGKGNAHEPTSTGCVL